MLKKFGRTPEDRPLIVLGITPENMTRLLADEPIMVDMPGAAYGLPGMPDCVIVLVGGKTEAAIAAQIASAPLAQFLADHPPTPGRVVAAVERSPRKPTPR